MAVWTKGTRKGERSLCTTVCAHACACEQKLRQVHVGNVRQAKLTFRWV